MAKSEFFKENNFLRELKAKNITLLLGLLDDGSSNVLRKLGLLAVSILLINEDAKLFLLEKLGLLAKGGRICLTRLKYLKNMSNKIPEDQLLWNILDSESKFNEKDFLFWYIKCDHYGENLNFHFYRAHEILNKDNNFNVEAFPDPLRTMVGVSLL